MLLRPAIANVRVPPKIAVDLRPIPAISLAPIADIRFTRHIARMRAVFISLLVALAIGCSGSAVSPQVDRLEIRKSGWSAADIAVNSQGQGQYLISDYPTKRAGSFQVSQQQFARLVERLRPFQREAMPFNDETMRQVVDAGCPKGVPFVTDAGAVWVHWVGPSLNEHFLADLGCDYERNAARNKELIAVVKSFPVPLKW